MAVIAHLATDHGESRDLYVRLNNFEQLANHGAPAIARFRGYLSKEAFAAGKSFVWEALVSFSADAPTDPWPLAYAALRAHGETEERAKNLNELDEKVADLERKLAAVQPALPDGADLAGPDGIRLQGLITSLTDQRALLAGQRPALLAALYEATAFRDAFAAATDA